MTMPGRLQVGDIIRIPDERIGESIIDEVFDASTAAQLARQHPLAARCDAFVARDPGDNLVVLVRGIYYYWDHETDDLIPLGDDPAAFAKADEP